MRTVEDAVLLYLLRDAHIINPSGYFDKAGRWYADEDEELPCCKRHYPSRSRRYRMIKHCRTLNHITNLLRVDYAAANRLLRTPEWRVIRKILQLDWRPYVHHEARPTVQEYAPPLLQKAKNHAHELTTTELDTFIDWIHAYCPEVGTVHWDALRAYNALKQQ
jgi:hypothetical protein